MTDIFVIWPMLLSKTMPSVMVCMTGVASRQEMLTPRAPDLTLF